MFTIILAILGLVTISLGLILDNILLGIGVFKWIIILLGLLLLLVALILDFKQIKRALASRCGKAGISSAVRASLVIGILFIVNTISINVYHRFDFTGLGKFTLSSQTKELVGDLSEPIEVIAFFTPRTPVALKDYALDLLDEYKNYSDYIEIRQIDPDLHPDQVRKYGIPQLDSNYGAIVFKSQAGQKIVYGYDIPSEAEYAFTGAILQCIGEERKKLYFLKGHGESSINSDYSDVKQALQDNLYEIAELDLSVEMSIPDDAAAIVAAGPTQSLQQSELLLLKEYYSNRGRIFLLLNPNPPWTIRQFLSDYGIGIQDGILLDPSSHLATSKDTLLIDADRNGFQLSGI